MGTPLTSATVASTYQALLKVGDNTAISSTLKRLSDGLGNDLPIYMNDNTISNRGVGNIESNTAFGEQTLLGGGSSGWSSAFGYKALKSHNSGLHNSAFGANAGEDLTSGTDNSLFGSESGKALTIGGGNTLIGKSAGLIMTTQEGNTGVGNGSLSDTEGNQNTALGEYTYSGGFNSSLMLGRYAVATANNQIVFGSSTNPVGAVTTETVSSTRTWSVVINGIARKILLA